MALQSLWKKALLVILLVIALYMISEDSFTVFTALQRHEPSWRIIRSLLQVNLLLWCAAGSFLVWSRTVSTSTLADLLFQPVHQLSRDTYSAAAAADTYHSVVEHFDNENWGDEEEEDLFEDAQGAIKHGNDNKNSATKPEWDNDDNNNHENDAHYESDGEVPEPSHKPLLLVPTFGQIASAAADNLLVILVALFFFTISSSNSRSSTTITSTEEPDFWNVFRRVAAPTFPLLLFVYMAVQVVVPWRKRGAFWLVVSLTPMAPWHNVTFRDGFIGDILTSAVRPMQDIAFTVVYLLFGLRGWWSQSYSNQGGGDDGQQHQQPSSSSSSFVDQANILVPAMERSWILHTVVLPMCMLSPLWWRFCQNLRQCYDYRQRWPYLGNAFKYFLAASVAVVGLFHPSCKQSALWLSSFVIATLYQVWWDVFMDWNLLDRQTWRLREKRLYSNRWVYWTICVVNLVLRFCWTLSFLPPRYLNAAGVLTENFSGDLNSILGATIAAAEIIRRTLWGLLRFEWEVVKETHDNLHSSSREVTTMEDDRGLELTPMKVASDGSMPSSIIPRTAFSSDMSSMNEIQVLGELCLYAGVFCLFGMVAAAHRGTA